MKWANSQRLGQLFTNTAGCKELIVIHKDQLFEHHYKWPLQMATWHARYIISKRSYLCMAAFNVQQFARQTAHAPSHIALQRPE